MPTPKIGRSLWRNSQATEPSPQPMTDGNVAGKTKPDAVNTEVHSASEPASPSIDTSVMDTENTVDSTLSPVLSMSAKSILSNGNEPTVWSLSPQSYIDSGREVTEADLAGLDAERRRKLASLSFGLGLSLDGTIRDISRFLADGGFDVYTEPLSVVVPFYLDNYCYA